MKTEYRKFTDRLAANAAGAELPSANPFSWLAGDWTWRGRPVTFALAPYGVSYSTDPFIIHDARSGMWILALADPAAFGILIGPPIRHGQATFVGDVTIAGQSVQLRQTWRLLDPNSIEIENERRHGQRWQLWDHAILQRIKPPN